MRKRDTDNGDRSDEEIKKCRINVFKWTSLLLPNAPIIVKIILLLGIGGTAAVTTPKVLDKFTAVTEELPIAKGETVVPVDLPPDLKQSLDSLDSAITKLQTRANALEGRTKSEDSKLESRIIYLEGQH